MNGRLIAELHSWEGVNTSFHQGGVVIHLKTSGQCQSLTNLQVGPQNFSHISSYISTHRFAGNSFFYIFGFHNNGGVSCKFSPSPILGICRTNESFQMLIQSGWMTARNFQVLHSTNNEIGAKQWTCLLYISYASLCFSEGDFPCESALSGCS